VSEVFPKARISLKKANVVGTFHCTQPLNDQETDSLKGIDAVEFRLDLLKRLPSSAEFKKYQKPWIMTARHPMEGGHRDLDPKQRLRFLMDSIPLASFVDLELRFWDEAAAVVELAREAGVGLIASFHDFSQTPSYSALLETSYLAQQMGADVIKLATYLNAPSDLGCLLQLMTASPIPLAAMGMGPLGAVSRLTLASYGSVLNYGWLGAPLVVGQWPAERFAERLQELDTLKSGR
jgi:3-dehydroquinate dehydratase-1